MPVLPPDFGISQHPVLQVNPMAGGSGILSQGSIGSPIVGFRQEAANIIKNLPGPQSGFVRLWRGNRPNEIGAATQFTNDLPGIALPFKNAYGGKLSYVDVPQEHLPDYLNTAGAATNAEFNLPPEIAKTAQIIQ